MTENHEAYLLAGLGAAQGFWRYMVRPEITAKRTWLLVGAVVAAHEVWCPPGQLMSEGVDRGLERHPVLLPAAILITTAHLLNKIPRPDRFDPYTVGLRLIKGHERG